MSHCARYDNQDDDGDGSDDLDEEEDDEEDAGRVQLEGEAGENEGR